MAAEQPPITETITADVVRRIVREEIEALKNALRQMVREEAQKALDDRLLSDSLEESFANGGPPRGYRRAGI
jgi:hypothetical protein